MQHRTLLVDLLFCFAFALLLAGPFKPISTLSAVAAAFDGHTVHGFSTCGQSTAVPMSSMATRLYGKVETLSKKFSPSSSLPVTILRVFLNDDGIYPNNPRYPTLLLRAVFAGDQADKMREVTADGQWTSPWAWGIFEYHHYHSKAWELLLCFGGEASVQLGGPEGPTVSIEKGDLVLIPPGVAHKQLNSNGSFTLLGSYPTKGFDGSFDTLTGLPTGEERHRIADCFVPEKVPICGFDIRELYEGYDT